MGVVDVVRLAADDVRLALLDGVSSPLYVDQAACAVRFLVFGLERKEETFVGAIGRPNVFAVERPVQTVDERGVLFELAVQMVLALRVNVVDVNGVVVPANRKVVFVRGVPQHFAPLLCFFEALDFLVKVFN